MQITFHNLVWSYLPRVLIFLAMTVCMKLIEINPFTFYFRNLFRKFLRPSYAAILSVDVELIKMTDVIY